MIERENGMTKNWDGRYRVLRREYNRLIKRFTTVSILRYAFVALFIASTLLLVYFIKTTNDLKKENIYLNDQNMKLVNQIDMYMDTALYFADASVAMDDTNANLKAVISEQEEQLMAYRQREELYDLYEYALYYNGQKTDLTYYQIQSLQEYCDDKGYSSDMVDLVLAVAMKESHCNEDAMNESGATGYCQLLGSTARMVYTKLQDNEEPYTHDVALDGEKNLQLAADYLQYLYEYHGNDPIKMIDSYRGTHVTSYINTIDGYLKKNGLSIYNLDLERIE